MTYTRRDINKLAIGLVPGAVAADGLVASLRAQGARPNSKFAGVQIAMNAPYNFGNNNMSADETLARCVQLGVSAVELRSQPVEGFLGVPPDLVKAAAPGGRAASRTPDEVAAQKAAAEKLRAWRVAAPMARAVEFRRKYEDVGVFIEIVKFDAVYTRSDDELDYCFTLAKTLGARAVSCEIDVAGTKRVGQFADKHRLMVGYHGHAETGPADWEQAFSHAAHNGANLDIGHFVAGGHGSPIPFLKQHHARITHIHVKDRKLNEGPNVPFGTGDTPIVDVLRLIRDNKWNIQATIEFEYPVPAGSDRMAEIAKCVEFCRKALL
jgi:sugar phosphate isomerase/epimerase